MADSTEVLKSGEVLPVFATLSEPGITLTVQAGGTVTLTDPTGAVAGGIRDAAVTGADPAAAAAVRAWYLLDTTGLSAGKYLLTFSVTALGSDSLIRTYLREAEVWVDLVPPALPTAGDVVALLSTARLTVPDTMDVGQALAAALLDIQHQSNRTFASVTEARRYSGIGMDTLEIDPCRNVTAVELMAPDGTVIYAFPGNEYTLLPINSAVKVGIKRTPWIVYPPAHFSFGVGNIRVTATFGEPIPDDLYLAIIEQAALILAPAVIRYTTQGVMEWREGDAMVRYHPNINHELIESWRAHIQQVCGHNHRWSL